MKILKILYDYWMKFVRVLGRVQSVVILFFIYFVGVGAVSLVSFIFRKDFLDKRLVDKKSFWGDRIPEVPNLEDSKKKF